MKPDFIWVGQGKSGSSLAFNVLSRHPQVHMGPVKEHNVFRRPINRQVALDRYAQAATGKREGQLFGDISPSYHDRPVRIDRIANFYRGGPLPKIILCLRHPRSFAQSRYLQVLKAGKYLDTDEPWPDDINTFVQTHLLGEVTIIEKVRHVVETLGGRDNICLLVYEEDFAGDYAFETRLHRFLGLDDTTRYFDPASDTSVNSGVQPWFALPKDHDHDIMGGGETAVLPAGAAAFCSVPNRSRVFFNAAAGLVAKMQTANDRWRIAMSDGIADQIATRLTAPLSAYVKSTFGRAIWPSVPSLPTYPTAAPPRPVRAFT